jgi:hypothetical protein
MSEILARFRGTVRTARTSGVLGLTLSGQTLEHPQDVTQLAFSGPSPADLPATIDAAVVHSLGDHQYQIESGAARWALTARAVHVHRDIAARFYRAIPPRPVPFMKRLFWRMVLALAATRGGLAVLRTLRR